jgi:hypothetical protein
MYVVNEDGQTKTLCEMSGEDEIELVDHYYSFGHSDYYDERDLLGDEFDEADGPRAERIARVVSAADVKDADADTIEIIVSAYTRGWCDAAADV